MTRKQPTTKDRKRSKEPDRRRTPESGTYVPVPETPTENRKRAEYETTKALVFLESLKNVLY